MIWSLFKWRCWLIHSSDVPSDFNLLFFTMSGLSVISAAFLMSCLNKLIMCSDLFAGFRLKLFNITFHGWLDYLANGRREQTVLLKWLMMKLSVWGRRARNCEQLYSAPTADLWDYWLLKQHMQIHNRGHLQSSQHSFWVLKK